MTLQNSKTEKSTETCKHGLQMSDEELESYFQSFAEIEESIGLVIEEGEDL